MILNLEDQIKAALKVNYVDKSKRYMHIMGVYEKSIKLSEHYKKDTNKVILASLMHDYTKYLSKEKQIELMQEANYDTSISSNLYHAYTAEYLAKSLYGIKDKEILNAIKYHPTGHPKMTDTLKILMIADITEENTRDYQVSKEVRKYEFISLDKALKIKLEYMVKDAKKRNYELSDYTKELIKEL